MCCPVYREVITNVRCRGAQYTLTAACTLIDKIRSIKRAIQLFLILKTVRSEHLRTRGLEEYCCRRKEWIRFGMSIDFAIDFDLFFNQFRSIFACFVCVKYHVISIGLGDGIRWVWTACIVVKKYEYVLCICCVFGPEITQWYCTILPTVLCVY